ncbi:hypothetical protein RWE15_19430 [Virgibacillus halophilus]|uniref:Uncharacterized protein n=1 Tax=Tigheibacillus halophilus TaxID=361280 RepID=A0ABU5C9X0_9BACI|nr:hypothetical protein [Virgibacillus halophilus]
MEVKRLLIMLAPQEADEKVLEAASFLSGSIIQSKASIQLFETGGQEEIKKLFGRTIFQKHYVKICRMSCIQLFHVKSNILKY